MAKIAPILFFKGIPKGLVLAIEGIAGHYRSLLQSFPVNAVGRFEGREFLSTVIVVESHGLVLGVRLAVGVGVFEGREVVCIQAGPDDVVFVRAVVGDQLQFGPLPVDAIGALGITGVHRVRVGVTRRNLHLIRQIVHPIKIAVLEGRVVRAVVAVPGLILLEYYFPSRGVVQFEPRAVFKAVDKIIVDHQLALRSDIQGRRPGNRRRAQQNQSQA